MKRLFAISTLLILTACAAPITVTPTPSATATSTTPPTAVPTRTPLISSLTPTVFENHQCSTESLIYSVDGVIESTESLSGIYSICIDDLSTQAIILRSEVVPDDWSIRSVEVSPAGDKVIFSANSLRGSTSTEVFVIDLSKPNHISKVFSTDYVIDEIKWSSDGEYIGYIKVDGARDSIETLHLDTSVTSQVVTPDMITQEELEVVNILNFDWSPDQQKFVYHAFVGEMPATNHMFIAEVNCNSESHECFADTQTETAVLSSFSWMLDSTLMTMRIDPVEAAPIIEIVNLDGEILEQIDIDASGQNITRLAGDPVLSSQNDRVAFTAGTQANSLGDIFVFSLADESLINLSELLDISNEVVVYELGWIP